MYKLSKIKRTWGNFVNNYFIPQSPDLSLNELVSDEIYSNVPPTYFYNLLENMPRIFSAVKNARGGFFDEKKILICFNWN